MSNTKKSIGLLLFALAITCIIFFKASGYIFTEALLREKALFFDLFFFAGSSSPARMLIFFKGAATEKHGCAIISPKLILKTKAFLLCRRECLNFIMIRILGSCIFIYVCLIKDRTS